MKSIPLSRLLRNDNSICNKSLILRDLGENLCKNKTCFLVSQRSFIYAGGRSESNMDSVNLLKSELARG